MISLFCIVSVYIYFNYYPSVSHDGNNNRLEATSVKTNGNQSSLSMKMITGLEKQQQQHLCGDKINGTTNYITEYVIPIDCSQPVGLAVDKNNNIWIAADWAGYLLVFNSTSNTFIKKIPLPNWHSEAQFGSMIWEMKFDKNDNLWFTDERSNSIWKYSTQENEFERYILPTKGGYPLSLVFDPDGKIWFTEIFGKKLGVLDPSKVENNTTKGISELDLSKQINFDTTGPISNGFGFNHADNNNSNINNKILWLSTVNFPIGGQLVKYDITKGNITVYDLTNFHTIPLSVAEDEHGRVWANDHASSLFLMLDPATKHMKQFATSYPLTVNTTTLPYYNIYRDGKLWFNEHYGNAIARFDINNNTVVEYHIPSEDPFWGNASNPLRFVFDNKGSVWFTEWTENKLGVVHKENMNNLPITISTSKNVVNINKTEGKGDTIDVYINKNNSYVDNKNNLDVKEQKINKLPNNITMFATSSMSKLGLLQNLTAKFSKDRFSIDDISNSTTNNQPYKITLEINPTKDVPTGDYTLTISARYNNEVTYSKIIDLNIR